MDKQQEAQADSLSTVTVKEYPPSEGYGSEPPPAYHKPRSNSVQIARLAAITIVVSSFVLGSFILAAAWIQASASCHQDLYDQAEHLLQPQALTQDVADLNEEPSNHVDEPLPTDDGPQQQQQQQQHEEQAPSDAPAPADELPADEHVPVRVRLPLQLDFDDIAGMLVQKNQRSRMNCVVEKKRAEEIVDHQPRTLKLPFGVNVTTDPRYEHVSGEKMAISCESGSDQRHAPMETMHGGPVVIPLPGPVNLPLQFHGPLLQHQQRLRAQQMQHQLQQQLQQQMQLQARAQPHYQAGPPPPPFHVQQLPFPMVVPVPLQTTIHVADQPEEAPSRQQRVQFPMPMHQQHHEGGRQMPPRLMQEARQGRMFPPIEVVELREGVAFPQQQQQEQQHIPLEVMEVREGREMHRFPQQQHHQQQQQHQQHIPLEVMEVREGREMHHFPQQQQQQQQPQPQQPEGLGPRAFHKLPVHVPMMQHQPPPPVNAEELRPHYVQPRSVRSVDDVLHRREKRMRRCACDCAC